MRTISLVGTHNITSPNDMWIVLRRILRTITTNWFKCKWSVHMYEMTSDKVVSINKKLVKDIT